MLYAKFPPMQAPESWNLTQSARKRRPLSPDLPSTLHHLSRKSRYGENLEKTSFACSSRSSGIATYYQSRRMTGGLRGKRLRDAVPRDAHAAWRAACGSCGPDQHPSRRGCYPAARAGAAAIRPDATITLHVLPRVRGRHGSRPRPDAGDGDPSPGVRRRASVEFWWLRDTRAPADLRYQRPRRDPSRAVGVGFKRLVASFVLAARANALSDSDGRDAAVACAASYRHAMRDFTAMDVLDIWYARLDDSDFLAMLPKERKAILRKRIAKAMSRSSSELVFPKLVEAIGEEPRIHDAPPTIFHPDKARAAGNLALIRETLPKYRETLAEDRRVLFDRYHLVDAAVKVVGIGSVGTLCMVLLMMSDAGHPLFLQVKEANASVLEAYAGKSAYSHHGQRVVEGQRLMQPASDLFLGWVTGPENRHFYLRQLRDVKLRALVETYDAEMLTMYGGACGWVLARAHAKAGDPWVISGYLGKGDDFDEAMGKFALAYADQAEQDHAALKAAVRAGIIDVELEN